MASAETMKKMEELLQAFHAASQDPSVAANLPQMQMGGQPGAFQQPYNQGGAPGLSQMPLDYNQPNQLAPPDPLQGPAYQTQDPKTASTAVQPVQESMTGGKTNAEWINMANQPPVQSTTVGTPIPTTTVPEGLPIKAGTVLPMPPQGPPTPAAPLQPGEPASVAAYNQANPPAPAAPTTNRWTGAPGVIPGATAAAQIQKDKENEALRSEELDRFQRAREALATPEGEREPFFTQEFGGEEGLAKIREGGMFVSDEAKDAGWLGHPPQILSDKQQAERQNEGKGPPHKKWTPRERIAHMNTEASRIERESEHQPSVFNAAPGEDGFLHKVQKLWGGSRFNIGGVTYADPTPRYNAFVKRMTELHSGDPNWKLSSTEKRNWWLGDVLKQLNDFRNANSAGENEELEANQRRAGYSYILRQWSKIGNWYKGEPKLNADARYQDLRTVARDFLNDPSSFFNSNAFSDLKLPQEVRQAMAEEVRSGMPAKGWGSAGKGVFGTAAGLMADLGILGLETVTDGDVEIQKGLPWAMQAHTKADGTLDHKIGADDPRVLQKIMDGRRREGEQQYVDRTNMYEQWVRLMATQGHKSLTDMHSKIERWQSPRHAKQFAAELLEMEKHGILRELGINDGPRQLRDLERQIETGNPVERSLHSLESTASGEYIPETLQVDEFGPEGGVRSTYEIATDEAPITYEPDKYLTGPQGQQQAGFLIHPDPITNEIRRPGDPGYDSNLAQPALSPQATENLKAANKEQSDRAEALQQKQKGVDARSTKAKDDEMERVIRDLENSVLNAPDKTGISTKEGGVSMAATVQAITSEVVKSEIDSLTKRLSKEENMLQFGAQITEAMTLIGDSLTNMAMGVRPTGKPSFIPTSIYKALQSVGAERESALMRLNVGAMTGHWFPEGTSVDSMKSQIPLLQHTQAMAQKERHWQSQLESGNWKAMLDYRFKIAGLRLDANQQRRLQSNWDRNFAHTLSRDADTYALARAKANMEHVGSIKLDRLELETINGLMTTLDMGKEVLREKGKFGTGWFKNWWQSLGNYGGWADPAWHAFKQKVTFQLNTYVNNLTGKQLSKHEVARLKGAVPQMSDDDGVFREKAKTFISVTQRILNRKLKTYALNGHDVKPFAAEEEINWKQNGVEKSSTIRAFSAMLKINPHLIGKLQLLTGPGGKVLRPGEDYLADTMRTNNNPNNYIIKGPDGRWKYNEAMYGAVDPGMLLNAPLEGGQYYDRQGGIRAGQRVAASYIMKPFLGAVQ